MMNGVWFVALLLGAGAPGQSEVADVLADLTQAYSEAVPETVEFAVQLDISPPGESWYVTAGGGKAAVLHSGSHDAPAMTLTMSYATLSRIYAGEITAFTAGGKASGADAAPLELEFGAAANELSNPKGTMLGFIQHFFERDRPERILLGEAHSRVVHGAHAIPLYYADGLRSAWYLVKDGQHLNEPGDTNPYPQAFIIISGHGRAKIGEVEVEVGPRESYYIPPDSDHILWPAPGDSVEVVWLAWGEGA